MTTNEESRATGHSGVRTSAGRGEISKHEKIPSDLEPLDIEHHRDNAKILPGGKNHPTALSATKKGMGGKPQIWCSACRGTVPQRGGSSTLTMNSWKNWLLKHKTAPRWGGDSRCITRRLQEEEGKAERSCKKDRKLDVRKAHKAKKECLCARGGEHHKTKHEEPRRAGDS